MLKELELTYREHCRLKLYCEDKKIMFLSTAFDLESLDFLEKELNLNLLKIPSGEITNGPLLLAYARTGCDLILSTGMATMREIEDALSVIAFGLLYGNDSHEMPSREVFNDSYSSLEGKELLSEKVTLLHCTT